MALAVAGPVVLTAGFAVDAGIAVRDLQQGVALLQRATTALGDPLTAAGPGHLALAADLQREASARIDSAAARLRSNPALEVTGGLPGVGVQSGAMIDLADSAGDAASAVGALIAVGRQFQLSLGGSGPPGPRLLRFVAASTPAVSDAKRYLDASLSRLERYGGKALVPPIGREMGAAIGRLRPARAAVATAVSAAGYLPSLLGAQRPQTYLLLFPNPSELRPAGGFVGSFGTLTVAGGSPTAVAVFPEESLDSRYRVRFPVPAALAPRLSFPGGSLDIGDAGWDPDFPATAQLIQQMYHSATGRTVDGTIAIDPYAISALLEIVGPVDVPPYGGFTGSDFFPKLNTIVNVPGVRDGGKKALAPVASAVLNRILTASPSLWPRMLAAIADQASGRHILVHLTGGAGSPLEDGALVEPPVGVDYQMVVDANVGGTKGDVILQKSIRDRVEVFADGVALHELVARYTYPSGVVDPTVPKKADPAYRDYLRFYIPEESSVTGLYATSAAGSRVGSSIEDLTVEHGKKVVGTFFRLPPGQSIELHLVYQTPVAPGGSYRLYVQKQAGVLARPVQLTVSYPGGVQGRELAGNRDEEVTLRW